MGDPGIIEYAVEDGVATISINRPERRNALSIAAAETLHRLWHQIDDDVSVRVVILTSADCGTFCAGMDLKEAAEVKQQRGLDILDVLTDPFYERMRTVTKPIIAAMTGHFAAGGMTLCLNSDLRVGLSGTRGGITEAKVGRGSPWAVPLLWMIPQPILMELVLTGEMMPIERLQALGFVNYVESTPEAVRARARSLAEAIRDNAPLTVQAGKESLRVAMDLGCRAGLREAESIYKKVYRSEDAQEGPRAFAEKRRPVWQGR
ncbi:MAG: enoyl-CoA hydratase/isomerase family protein [Hyphomicrobiaceae bacterium]|nr:enoyl-CoA hydratase/isomerase family protein [Hyphomicrobiaceae bacterium]